MLPFAHWWGAAAACMLTQSMQWNGWNRTMALFTGTVNSRSGNTAAEVLVHEIVHYLGIQLLEKMPFFRLKPFFCGCMLMSLFFLLTMASEAALAIPGRTHRCIRITKCSKHWLHAPHDSNDTIGRFLFLSLSLPIEPLSLLPIPIFLVDCPVQFAQTQLWFAR